MRCSIGGREKARGEAGFSFRGRGALLLAVCGEDAKGEIEGAVDGVAGHFSPRTPKGEPRLPGSRRPGRRRHHGFVTNHESWR